MVPDDGLGGAREDPSLGCTSSRDPFRVERARETSQDRTLSET